MSKATYLQLSFLLLAACGGAEGTSRFARKSCFTVPHEAVRKERLVAFGDSMTKGSVGESCLFSFAEVLARESGRPFLNLAVSGSVALDHLRRIESFSFSPDDSVTLFSGYNDAILYGTDESHLRAYKETLMRSLQNLSGNVDRIIVGTIFSGPKVSPAAVLLYATAVREIVAEFPDRSIVLIDVTEEFSAPEWYARDGIHLTRAGQLRLADLVREALQEGEE